KSSRRAEPWCRVGDDEYERRTVLRPSRPRRPLHSRRCSAARRLRRPDQPAAAALAMRRAMRLLRRAAVFLWMTRLFAALSTFFIASGSDCFAASAFAAPLTFLTADLNALRVTLFLS